MLTVLDGPMGTELEARGVDTGGRAWSARALDSDPSVVAAIHADYARAGATVHTANTFRTQPRSVGSRFAALARRAVGLARGAVPAGHRVAGSVAPLEDCYSPERSPPEPEAEHAALIEVLAEAGVDLLLVETFPHVPEALAAVRRAVATGLPVWLSLTPGYRADLLTPGALYAGACAARDLGAAAVLVNCAPASQTLAYVQALSAVGLPFGAYANGGAPDEGLGWGAPGAPAAYLAWARRWREAGASLLGGCCGTSPAVIAALAMGLSEKA